MCKKNKRTGKINLNLKNLNFRIEEDYHRSPLQRFLHILCFITPVVFAFIGYLISESVWNFLSDEIVPENFRFALSITLFLISITVIFIRTRSVNPTMKMRTRSAEKTEQEEQISDQ